MKWESLNLKVAGRGGLTLDFLSSEVLLTAEDGLWTLDFHDLRRWH